MAYPRRSLFWPVTAHAAGMLFMIAWLSGPLFIAILAWTKGTALEQRGIEVEGTITELWTENSEGSRQHVGKYSYEAAGQVFSGRATVPSEKWEELEVGGKVLVRIVADDPEVSASLLRRDLTDKDGGEFGVFMVCLAFAAVGVAVFVGMGFSANNERRKFWLRDHGVLREARVLTSEKDEGGWDVTWRDDTGVVGKVSGIEDRIHPEVGATITIFAHPTRRWPTVWEGDIGSR